MMLKPELRLLTSITSCLSPLARLVVQNLNLEVDHPPLSPPPYLPPFCLLVHKELLPRPCCQNPLSSLDKKNKRQVKKRRYPRRSDPVERFSGDYGFGYNGFGDDDHDNDARSWIEPDEFGKIIPPKSFGGENEVRREMETRRLERALEGDGSDDDDDDGGGDAMLGSDSDSSLDLHTPLPYV